MCYISAEPQTGAALELVWVSEMREQKEDRKKEQEEARFTQGSSDGLLFGRASGVRVVGSCCTATVTRVTSLRQLSSAASRRLGVRTFRTAVKDDKVHTFHPCLLTLVWEGREVRESLFYTTETLFTEMWEFSLYVLITHYISSATSLKECLWENIINW